MFCMLSLALGVDQDINQLKTITIYLKVDINKKDRKPKPNDITEHGMERLFAKSGQSPKMPKSESILKNQLSNGAGTENTVGCNLKTILMGRESPNSIL
ncbi:hypothetical protein Tco_1407069 [Tanacetum coccineum]